MSQPMAKSSTCFYVKQLHSFRSQAIDSLVMQWISQKSPTNCPLTRGPFPVIIFLENLGHTKNHRICLFEEHEGGPEPRNQPAERWYLPVTFDSSQCLLGSAAAARGWLGAAQLVRPPDESPQPDLGPPRKRLSPPKMGCPPQTMENPS